VEHVTLRKSWLDRSLSLFTEVHAGEGPGALLLATNVFFLLAFYSVLKVIRDALILSEAGAVAASYASAGQALLLLGFVPAYGAFASRVNRLRLVCGVTLFFASHLIVFYLLGAAGVRIGIAFFLWIGVFNMVAVAQFWAFANDVYSTERGKRLFPILGVGANLGAVIGAGATAAMFRGVGPYTLMLIAAAGLLVPVALTIWVDRRERSLHDHARSAEAEQPLGKAGGFQLVLRQRYLLFIALLIVLLNLVNTLGGFMLNRMMETEAVRMVAPDVAAAPGSRPLSDTETQSVRATLGALSGANQTWWNLIALLSQLFLISRIFKYIGVRGALFIMPLVALGGYTLTALLPIFGIVRITKIIENGTDYSIQNTTRHALFLPTSREAKYKAKQAIDAFFVRAGDFLQAVVVFVGSWFALTVQQFAVVNVLFVVLALALVAGIRREHKKLVPVDVARKAA
jgi:AAA family ATP:ADP antiporter